MEINLGKGHENAFPVSYPDHELVEGLLREDASAYRDLLRKYTSLVSSAIIRMGISDSEDIKDVTQEVWIKVTRYIGTFDPTRAAFKTWLYAVAKGAAIDYLKIQNRYERGLDRSNGPAADYLPGSFDPEIALQRAELRAQIKALLQRLPPRRRAIFICTLSGSRPAEIAQELGIRRASVDTVKQKARMACWEAVSDSFPEGHNRVLELLRKGHGVTRIAEVLSITIDDVKRLRRQIPTLARRALQEGKLDRKIAA